MSKFPQVLLLGNGINQAYGGDSWNALLQSISKNDRIPKDTKLTLPMPLQAVLVTNDHVSTALKENRDNVFGKIVGSEHATVMQKLLGMGFDHILTTNYSYELELAAMQKTAFDNDKALKKMMGHTSEVNRAEAMYMLHTFNEVTWMTTTNRVWHIHGESRKPDSMILGHYYYANLLQRVCLQSAAASGS